MSYTRLLFHIVFRTKHSIPAINMEHENELYRYIWGYIKNKDCILYRIGGMPDHIHMLIQIRATILLSDFMRDLKTATSKYLQEPCREAFPMFSGWGKSYCAISCSPMEKDSVVDYIKGQKVHHKKTSFQEELLKIFSENNIDDNVENFLKE